LGQTGHVKYFDAKNKMLTLLPNPGVIRKRLKIS